MNGHGREPPDGHQFDPIQSQHESISSEVEIKQEPNVKEEAEDDDCDGVVLMTRPAPAQTVIGSLENSIGNKLMFYYDVNKMKLKIEKSSAENLEPQNGVEKHFVKTKPSDSNDEAARNNRITNQFGKVKKQPEGKMNGKRHKCTSCDYSTDFKSHLKRHMLKHTGERPFPCSVCQKRFTQKPHLQDHMKTHVDQFLFSCATCLQGFDRREKKVEHEADCKVRRYECHLCKKFSTLMMINLKHHLRVHTGERPIQCDVCSKKFNHPTGLRKHRKTHTNPRPMKLKCSICFKICAQPKEKENHEANCKRRGYRCDVCKSFTTDRKDCLMTHMRIHTGEKPFQCEICSKRFIVKSHLNRHKKIHN